MIIGLVDMDSGNGFFNKFQEIEFLSLVASGAGCRCRDSQYIAMQPIWLSERVFFFHYADPMYKAFHFGG